MIASYDSTPLYWLYGAVSGLPAALWMFIGVGLPWALVLLPRKDWRDKTIVACITLIFGPALVTAWMFVLGTIGAAQNTVLLRFDIIFGGTLVIAFFGVALAWRKQNNKQPESTNTLSLATDEKLLILLIAVALILRFITTAYWPFTAYDELWVYGYEGRLFFLKGFIPQDLGYYPLFLPLQYSFVQLAVGAINDHAARVILPFLHFGTILAAYVLGSRLFTRRTGIILAALWALYPHVGDWAHVGDLEIPTTFLFTTSAAFFLMAWTNSEAHYHRQYALIAGLSFGVAMWTKPTAGAFAWGVILLVAVELLRQRFNWRAWWPRFEVALITGVACIPLGGIWYIRNMVLGHNPIDLPPTMWLSLARRSGDLFGWPLLAIGIAFLYVVGSAIKRREGRYIVILIPIGLGLLLAGILPSLPSINPTRYDPPASYIMPLEWLNILVGLIILVITIGLYFRERGSTDTREQLAKISWASLLALPYFITFFYSYSYHYRLSFAIVPLMALPTAVILARFNVQRFSQNMTRHVSSRLYLTTVLMIGLPGVLSTIFDINGYAGWLFSDKYPDDISRYTTQNPEVVITAFALDDYLKTHDNEPIVIAPGEQRLRFFFPLMHIDNQSTPTQLKDLELAGATHFVYGAHARWRYEELGIPPENNQIISALARNDIMTQVSVHADATFRYELYELHLNNRFLPPAQGPILHLVDDEILLGDKVRYVGDNVTTLTFVSGEPVFVQFLWQVLQPMNEDYKVYVELLNQDDGKVYARWEEYVSAGLHGYYSTRLWEPGEYVISEHRLILPEPQNVPTGRNYKLIVGLFNPQNGESISITINGQPSESGAPLVATFKALTP